MTQNSGSKLEILTRSHEEQGVFDPAGVLSVYSGADLILLESADVITKLGEKSIVGLDLALKVLATGDVVTVSALMSEGEHVIALLREQLSSFVIAQTKDAITLKIPPLYHHLDLLEKMRSTSALDVLRAVLGQLHLSNGRNEDLLMAGVFSYDFLDHFEKLPDARSDLQKLPNYQFYLPLTLVVFDHKQQVTRVFAHGIAPEQDKTQQRFEQALRLVAESKSVAQRLEPINPVAGKPISNFDRDISDDDFCKLVEKCKEHIYAGDVYQIVPSRTFFRDIKDPIASYRVLRQLNPSPYMFFVKTPEWSLFGASPETFIKVDKGGGRVSIRPIAGTRRRGFQQDGRIDDELDSREQASLCLDEKELAEHMMLVDLARNDIASVCRKKSRRVKRLLSVDRFSHVMHLVSEVEGVLLKDFDALSAYQASMNMGTLMGAPKVRAAELLRTYERTKRGFYGGAVGYIDRAGNMDTAIIIRSALVKGNTAYVRAGCGVVSDSNPHFEMQETINKAEAVLRAIDISGGA